MRERTRMFRALGCLIFSMTLCAALLAWMAPSDPQVIALNDPEYCHRQASAAVALDGSAPMIHWRAIELVPSIRLPSNGRSTLAAVQSPSVPDYHFMVSDRGVVHPAGAWRHQQRGDGRTAAILVALVPDETGGDMPVAQWVALRALLVELVNRSATLGDALPVRIDPTVETAFPNWTRALRRWLVHDGFIR